MRFPEFTGEWKKTTLHSIAKITKGTGIPKDQLSMNGLPCILYGELYTKYKSEIIGEIISRTDINSSNLVKSKANDVIIPSSGETAIDISTARYVPHNDVLLGGDLNIIRLKNDDGCFLSYQLNGTRKLDIAKMAQGVSVVHLYGEKLKNLHVFMPEKTEQHKISSMLSLVDSRISTQSKIIEQLKSLIKGLSNKTYNSLSSYERKKLKDCCAFYSGGTPITTNKEYYNGQIAFVRSGEINCDSTELYISAEGLANSSAKLVCKGDLLLALYGATSGEIAISQMDGAINQAILCIKTPLNKVFFKALWESQKENILRTYLQGGQGNLSADIVRNITFPIPPMEKQENIARLYSLLDNKLKLEKFFLMKYTEEKSSLLQHLFI